MRHEFGPEFGPEFGGLAANPLLEARDTLTRLLADALPAPWTFHAQWPQVVTYPCVLLLPAPEWCWSASIDGATWRTAWQVQLGAARTSGGEPALAILEQAVWTVLQALLPARPLGPVEFRAVDGDPDILTATIPLELVTSPDDKE